MTYNKLVRDKIPEIIKKNGEEPEYHILDDDQFEVELRKKLEEELQEYLEEGDLEELADVLEVIKAILDLEGKDMLYLEEVRRVKSKKRGGFQNKIFLKNVKN